MKKLILSLLFCYAIIASPVFCEEETPFSFAIDSGVDRIFGYTLYAIGWGITDPSGDTGTFGRKISELRFPLDTYIAFGNINAVFADNWEVNIGFWKNIVSPPGGKMQDSDWGYWALNGYSWASDSSLDVYSLSDSNVVNAYSIDGDFLYRYKILPGFEVSAGLGFIYRYFYFEVSNLDQWYPSYETYKTELDSINPAYANHFYQPGTIGTYEAYYIIPFIELSAILTLFDNLIIDVTAGYSPFVKVLDADNHMLRYKLSYGDSTGMAIICDIDCRYRFTQLFFAGVKVNFMMISASGRQKQIRYKDTGEGPAGPIGTIDTKINSLQMEAGIFIGLSY